MAVHAGVLAAIIAASIFGSGAAWAACPSGKARNCVDLDLVPRISQQVVAAEPIAAPPKKAPAAEPIAAYTGPTIGLNPMVRRAPQIGYRWALD